MDQATSSSAHSSRSWQCHRCMKLFANQPLLERHCRTNACSLECSRCLLRFTAAPNRIRHEKANKCSAPGSASTTTAAIVSAVPAAPRPTCSTCKRTFSTQHNLRVHERSQSCSLTCQRCGRTFTEHRSKRRHLRKQECGSAPIIDRRSLRRKIHRANLNVSDGDVFLVQKSAFRGRLVNLYAPNVFDADDTETFFTCIAEQARLKIEEFLDKWTSLKVNFTLEMTYDKPGIESSSVNRAFHTPNVPVYEETDIDQLLTDDFDKMLDGIVEYEGWGSGYTLAKIDGLLLSISKYTALKGGCHLPLPSFIARRHACDSTIYEGNDCFRHAILAGSDQTNDLDFTMLEFPTCLEDICKFERANGVSVNVFGIDSKNKIYPLKVAGVERPVHRDLLLLKTNEHPGHYVRIFDFERLVSVQMKFDKHSKRICRRCLTPLDFRYRTVEQYNDHRRLCTTSGPPTRIVLPDEKSKRVSFTNVHRSVRLPFVIYVDTECILEPISSCEPSTASSFTTRYQKHTVSSFCVMIAGEDPLERLELNKPYVYRGDRAGSKLIHVLENSAAKIMAVYQRNVKPPRSKKDLKAFAKATTCHLCREPLNRDKPVFDHDHITGKYRGAAHSKCNLMARQPGFIPVIFHGGSHYDFKLIIRELGSAKGRVKIIPHTEENFISFSLNVVKDKHQSIWLRFIDSIRFLPSSLDTLVKNMSREQFTILPKMYQGDQLELMLRKQVFPYDAISSWESYERTSLPTKDEFYNRLHGADISDEDYAHAQKVWSAFNIQTLGEYSDLYLRMDTILLHEVFENFRSEFLSSEYGLDPAHYYSLPGLSWDGALRQTRVKLELITDYDVYQTVESGIRGGFVQAVTRHAVSDDVWQLLYVDANNLYGFASSMMLPTGGLAFVDDPSSADLLSVPADSPVGYFAEVDIDVPSHLHDIFNEYPLLPEKMTPPGSPYVKLVGTLSPKRKYVLHYRTLQFAIAHGLVLRKVHRVIRFNQSAWLAPFINFNTEKRKLAVTQFMKDLWKLLNNATFGKTIENVRARRNIKLATSEKDAQAFISKPSFVRRTILQESVAIIHMAKESVKLDKPIFIGFAILELAKLHMASFHYDIMVPRYGPERLRLIYTDTDSFIYNIKTDGNDWRTDVFAHLRQEFDFSDLPSTHPCHSNENKKVLGKFKDELAGKRLLEIVALRAKMYSMRIEGGEEVKKAKGTKKSAVKNHLTFEDYKRLVFDGRDVIYRQFNSIRSFRHELFSGTVNKKSLSPLDDKRYILSDKITTLAHGHRDIEALSMDVDGDDDEFLDHSSVTLPQAQR